MFKKIISCLLAITLILVAIPMVVVSAQDNALPNNMLYIKTEETGKRLYQRAAVEVGKSYYFSFGISSDISFRPVCRTDGNRNGVEANITQISNNVKGDVTIYTYSFTIPETDNNGNAMTPLVFFGIQIDKACEGYFFDASVYESGDVNKTELLGNPDFADGILDLWAWDWSAWFIGSQTGVGLSEWTNDAQTTTLKVMSFDSSLLVDESVSPKMLYINTTAPERFMSLVSVAVGETYYFTFTLTTGVEFNAVCRTNGLRYGVDASIEQIDAITKGECTIYTYSYTIPETDTNGTAMTPEVFVGIQLKKASECYFFDASFYQANDKYKAELLPNSNFANGYLDNWAWDWDAWFIASQTGAGYTEWSNSDTTLKVVEYDDTLLMEEDTLPKMLYINTNSGKELYQRVPVTVGETYYFSFCVSGDANIGLVCRTNGSRNGFDSQSKLIAKSYRGSTTSYTYSFTIPETDNSGNAMTDLVFVGVKINSAYEGYFFNATVYNSADVSKTELLENTNFAEGNLDNWALGWDAWFIGSQTGSGLKEWTNADGKVSLKVVKFDESIIADSDDIQKMMYIKTFAANKDFYQRANVLAGETYYFSFALSSNIKFAPLCRADDNRPAINADIQLINQATKGDISIYTYSYTLPTTDDVTDLVFFGIRFTEACEGYFFDASLKAANDIYGFEYLENPDFADGSLNQWSYGFDKWFSSSDSNWSNSTAEIKVIDFDNVLLNPVPEKMLYINSTLANQVLYQRAKVEIGKTYNFRFNLSSNIDFVPVCVTDDKRNNIEADVKQINAVTSGNNTEYTYSFTIPETDSKGNAMTEMVFFGIKLTTAAEGYLFDTSLFEEGDKYEIELFENPDFATGNLDRWALGWDIWFAPSAHSTSNVGISEWSNADGTVTLKVEDYNDDLSKSMLFVRYESVDMQGESLIQKIETLKPDTEYTVSFKYHFSSGALNSTIDFTLMGDPVDSDKLVEKLIQSSAENNECLVSTSDNGIIATYKFKLDSSTLEKYQGIYAGFYFKISPRIITEFYISDFVIYKSDDESKTNLFVKDNFNDMYGWQSNWIAAAKDSKTFGWDTVDYLDYLAQYMPYDADLFTGENTVIHYGDANFDGVIDIRDLVAFKKHLVNLKDYIENLDCSKDGNISSDDITILRKHLISSELIEWEDEGKSMLQKVETLSGGADADAETLKQQITSQPDTLSGTVTYYVSESGTSTNDGRSKDSPINIEKLRTLSFVNSSYVSYVVLFKRGENYRLDESLKLTNGVSYGAYGTGDKPVISGSLKNYSDKVIWSTEDGFIWKTVIDADDIGTIVFDNGEYVGFKKSTLKEIKNDGDFWFDTENKVLYLYLRQINPANRFDTIEISTVGTLLSSSGSATNITIENLSFKYVAVHGINIYNCSNVNISGCEFAWIGGGYDDSGSRYGNAIQFWDSASNCNVTNNYIYQIYDAAVTFQGNDAASYSNLTYKNNLIEYTSMNFEFWDSETVKISNIDFSDNILRFAGYGFSGIQRTNGNNQAYILAWRNTYNEGNITNFNITNNIFDIANCYYFYAVNCIDSLGVSGNTYYQNSDCVYSINAANPCYATDFDSFEANIKAVDNNANVNWIEN